MEKKIVVAFGRALRNLRVSKKLTQEQLGFLADLQRKHVSSLELGTKQPNLSTVFALARGLGVKAGYLVSCVEEEYDSDLKAQGEPSEHACDEHQGL